MEPNHFRVTENASPVHHPVMLQAAQNFPSLIQFPSVQQTKRARRGLAAVEGGRVESRASIIFCIECSYLIPGILVSEPHQESLMCTLKEKCTDGKSVDFAAEKIRRHHQLFIFLVSSP